ncbi:MAG: urease accessory protein UreD [Gammaproteobacteria bacterium]|nr:urease accessory protein UreD [Gammaproteobacteria bacterium]
MLEANKSEQDWQAHLQLEYSRRPHGTVLSKNQHTGPLLVQKPLYPEHKEICHSYILHPPGGLVQGDCLQLDIDVLENAHALVTTPAATKFYRCEEKVSKVIQSISVSEQAKLEWLPQENLLFNESLVNLETIIKLTPESKFIGWEMLCLGRKASNEKYTSGSCRQSFEIWRNDEPLYIERSHLSGSQDVMTQPWGLDNKPVSATMLATNCDKEVLLQVREIIEEHNEKTSISVTLKEDLLICRYLGEQAEKARSAFAAIWSIIRPITMGYNSHNPRIWST